VPALKLPPKHHQVFKALREEIDSGMFKGGERLPSEFELGRRFEASRITIGRAVRDLQLLGLVHRRAGSGTFVTKPAAREGLSFGLLIPDLGETEIFESICRGMMASPLAKPHALLWGSAASSGESKDARAWHACRQYIDRRVAGVFFAPLELEPQKDQVNAEIGRALDAAGIPVVLLDRTLLPYPERGHHDLVGIDNRRAGYVMTAHLLSLGARRVAFVGVRESAATVEAREAGYREALHAADVPADRALVQRLTPDDSGEVRAFMSSARPEAILCANDWTAARLMRTLLDLGYRVPDDVRLAGIDDLHRLLTANQIGVQSTLEVIRDNELVQAAVTPREAGG
jgi:DNA-binding LacI/PurR family transcriptional regulator